MHTSYMFIFLTTVLAGIIGWIANSVQLVHTINDPITVLMVLKCIGILAAPLGAVLGYIGMF